MVSRFYPKISLLLPYVPFIFAPKPFSMHLHPLPSTANRPIPFYSSKPSFNPVSNFLSCSQQRPLPFLLSGQSLGRESLLGIERFIMELGLAFFQRLQKIEQVSSEPITMRQTMIQANQEKIPKEKFPSTGSGRRQIPKRKFPSTLR